MQSQIRLLGMLSLLLSAVGCEWEVVGGRYKKDFFEGRDFAAGGRLSLESRNGSVEIVGWEKERVEITAVKSASREELLEAIQIDIRQQGNHLDVRTRGLIGREGSWGVNYVVRVPSRTALERIETSNGSVRVEMIEGAAWLRTSNGPIRVYGLKGPLQASTSNGRVELQSVAGEVRLQSSNGSIEVEDLQGSIEASTSNASVRVRIRKPAAGQLLRLSTSNGGIDLTMETFADNPIRAYTSNGSIRLTLPAQVRATLHASTTNGSIASDFEGQWDSRRGSRLAGPIGGGGAPIDLATSNGGIKIVKLHPDVGSPR